MNPTKNKGLTQVIPMETGVSGKTCINQNMF